MECDHSHCLFIHCILTIWQTENTYKYEEHLNKYVEK